jgi:FtsZ-binding cell division protein ZapB
VSATKTADEVVRVLRELHADIQSTETQIKALKVQRDALEKRQEDLRREYNTAWQELERMVTGS